MQQFELEFYRKSNGDCPVSEFMSSLNEVMRFKLMHSLDMLELWGNRPRGDYSKFVEDGIFEVRAQTKTDITRVLFFFDANRRIVLTNGFVKKTQKTPLSEVEIAKRYRADHIARAKERSATPDKNAHVTAGTHWRPKLDDILREAEKRSPNNSKPKNKQKEHCGR